MRLIKPLAMLAALVFVALTPSAALAQDSDSDDGFLLRISGSDRIAEDERIDTAMIIDGDLSVAGTIVSDLIAIDADVHIENGALIAGDIVMVSGEVTLRDGSRVTGDILLGSDAHLITETGAEHTGSVEHDAFAFDFDRAFAANLALGYLSIWIVLFIVSAIAAIVFAGVGGRQLQSASDYITSRPGGTILSSLLFWLAIAMLALLLLLTILAAPLIALLMILGCVLWFLGMLVAGTRIGAFLLRRPSYDPDVDHPYATSLLGTLVLQVVVFVAGGGGLFLVVIAILTDDVGLLGGLIGIPVALLGITALLAGFLGAGALVYRALRAWTNSETTRQTAPDSP